MSKQVNRIIALCVIVLVSLAALLLSMNTSHAAQAVDQSSQLAPGPQPTTAPPIEALRRTFPPTYGPIPTSTTSSPDDLKCIHRPCLTGNLSPQGINMPSVALGQPGVSFRYMQTFGVTGQPYLSDTSHINYPWGLGTDGTNVWIGERNGLRALKFTSTGSFIAQIGMAGVHDDPSVGSLGAIDDVAVDGSGNVWLADGANHVIKFDTSYHYLSELGHTWNAGSDNDHFQEPVSLAFDGAGNIYVSDGAPDWSNDVGNHRIQIFDSAGNYLNTIGMTDNPGSSSTQFHGPRHIAIFANILYVADSANNRVQLFNVSAPLAPVYVATIGISGVAGGDNSHLNNPSGVAVDTSFIYIADTWNNRVQVFNRGTRAYVATIGTGWGTSNAQFKNPADVAVDAVGNIYVADYDNSRVQQFNSGRVYVRTYGVTGVPYVTDRYHYNDPHGVAVAADGSVYIVEESGQRLVKVNSAGVPQWAIGAPGVTGGWNGDNAYLNYPDDLALDATGRVYIADQWNHRIQIFDPNGTYVSTLGLPGSSGTGNNQFNDPRGLTVAPNGYVYVADTDNHRVQIFDSNRNYVATLGTTGVSGSDNSHFQNPEDVVVDSLGRIYVADSGNLRVQVFNPNRTYLHTLGVTGVAGNDFSHFNGPYRLAVDAQNNLYQADGWNCRVQVFDSTGAYLTTIGGSCNNSRPGQIHGAFSVALDRDGAVYLGDSWNFHRVQKFALGVPGWVQTNINGFGERSNFIVQSVVPFSGQLYAGTSNASGNGAQIWRMTGSVWTSVMTNGFGNAYNQGIDHLAEFNGNFYAGTANWDNAINDTHGGEIWRSSDGAAWSQVSLPGFDTTNGEIERFAVFSSTLYAGTWSYTDTHGLELWRSSTGNTLDWTRVISNGFDGDTHNQTILSFEAFNGYLYAGTFNFFDGGEVWRSTTGDPGTWAQINTDGFGAPANRGISALAAFNGYLYAATHKAPNSLSGSEVWRCQACDGSDWTKVVNNGFGNINTFRNPALEVFDGRLYFVVGNWTTGLEVWRSADGITWEQVGFAGFGNSNNTITYWDNSVAVFSNRLYIGTYNSANGGQIWKKTVTAGFTANPVEGTPPFNVSFTNASGGDYITSTWDFGDGITSTLPGPTHTYAAIGTYTVTLTINDGVDTQTLIRPAYIRALRHVYLPLVLRNFGTMLYDDFNNPAFNGSYDSSKWSYSGLLGYFTVIQQNGALVFMNTNLPGPTGADLAMLKPGQRTLSQLQQFEARLKVSSNQVGGYAFAKIQIRSDNIAGHGWFTQCRLGASTAGSQPQFICDVVNYSGGTMNFEYTSSAVAASYDTWYTARIEADPTTAQLRFYLNGNLVGTDMPSDALYLLTVSNLQPQVGIWNDAANTTETRYIDDVRITSP